MSKVSVPEPADDSQDSSDVFPIEQPAVNLLEEFREKWQQEISSSDSSKHEISNDGGNHFMPVKEEAATNEINPSNENVEEDKAKVLFEQAAELEKLGKVFEAMRLYRRAVQLVPDIEFKMYESTKKLLKDEEKLQKVPKNEDSFNGNDAQVNDINDNEEDDPDDTELEGVDLISRFLTSIQRTGHFFQRSTSSDTITSGRHISDLPMEIILYILKWVVSSDLDLRSLDQCSSVCKGFYICAKDEEIWRLACLKIWGVQVGLLKGSSYLSWRHMYLDRHRVHFNGCYISKTSYLRYGENSFQDQSYRPIHLIEYYRYVRFFPDGHILMMTTPEDPTQSLAKLRVRNTNRSDILKGHYRLHGDIAIIVLQRSRSIVHTQKYTRRTENEPPEKNQTFYLEFNIVSSNKRKFNQLKWKNYSIIEIKKKNEEVTTDFDLKSSLYPPLIFSRVKSYHSISEYPLN